MPDHEAGQGAQLMSMVSAPTASALLCNQHKLEGPLCIQACSYEL